MAFEPGTTLGPYSVTAKIGEGGMGEVYRARDTKLDRDVALKVLPQAFTDDPDRLARFEREAKVLASLNHPNIGGIHGLEESDGIRALVLEYIDGPTLADRIAQGPIPVDEALPIAKQIAEALEAAHEQGVIHRDLKPANVKVKPDGTVKVLDFGLAKALDPTPEGDPSQSPTLTAAATQMGVVLGTAAYMSPEQARGKAVDKRADIWAFGAVLYEMLTGRRAFGGHDVTDTMAAVLRADVSFDTLPPETPSRVGQLLKACLQRDPKQRVHDMADVRLAMEGTFETPASASELAAATQPQTWQRPIPLALAGLAILIAGGLAVWALTPVPLRPVTRFVVQPPADTTVFSGAGFAITPDGRTLLIQATGGLYRRDLGSLESVFIPGTENAWMPFVSPDGESVAFVDDVDNVLERVRLDGSGLQTLSEVPSSGRSGAWSEGDTIVFNSATLGGLMRVSAMGGTAQPVDAQMEMVWLDLLPGGRQVLGGLTDTYPSDPHVGLFSLETGESRSLFPGTMPRYAGGHIVYWRDGALWAAPFDLGRLEVTGAHSMLATGVYALENGVAGFVVADEVLAYQPGAFRNQRFGVPVWVSPEGDEEPLAIDPGLYNWPRISPDGSKIALTRVEGQNQDVWVFDLRTGAPTRITVHQALDATPVWTADSGRVVFRSQRDGPSNLYWRSADASDEVTPLTDQPMEQRPVSVTTDGVLLFEDIGEGYENAEGVDVWSMPMEPGAQPSRVLAESFNESQPIVSPDGALIAYQSTELGYPEIFVGSFPELIGARMFSVLDAGMNTSGANADAREARAPVWSRDGATLYYQSGAAIVGVPMGAGGTAQIVFRGSEWPFVGEGRHYDVHPDGRFIRIRREALEDTPNELVVVMNWQGLLDED